VVTETVLNRTTAGALDSQAHRDGWCVSFVT
jgi:hypothetical protein